MKDKKLIGPITQLLSMDQLPMKGALKDSQLPIHKHAGILLDGDKIVEIGDFEILRKKIDLQEVRRIDLSENYVALPGMIDCHT
nr:imidazolonepropionase [Algoriphagus sp.]